MFIEPIRPINGIGEVSDLQRSTDSKGKNDLLFKSIFEDALNNYVGNEAKVDEDVYKLSTGESDDLHNLMINMKKAEMSLDLVIQVRNKALDAYNEIMRMGV